MRMNCRLLRKLPHTPGNIRHEIRRAQPQRVEHKEEAIEREETHVVVHHNIERVSADGQREPALDDMRREQAGNP